MRQVSDAAQELQKGENRLFSHNGKRAAQFQRCNRAEKLLRLGLCLSLRAVFLISTIYRSLYMFAYCVYDMDYALDYLRSYEEELSLRAA